MSATGATELNISTVYNIMSVNPFSFINQVYPQDGTRDVTRQVTVQVQKTKIALISILSVLALVLLGLSILYYCLSKK